MANVPSSGIEPGQRRLNGPQTTGREYRNLSQPTHAIAQDDDVAVAMRDGINLLADVHRPAESGRYPVLVAASPYPRQIQNLGAPAGFIEAGASDFFVPVVTSTSLLTVRARVGLATPSVSLMARIVVICTTSSSGLRSNLVERQCRHDRDQLFRRDTDGGYGGTTCALKAIMPIAGTFDLYESARHHGLMRSGFVTPFLFMIGMTSPLHDRHDIRAHQ
jgi:hypothetical protein